MITTETLHVSYEAGYATLTFGHPAGNSCPSSLLHRLTTEIENLNHRKDIGVLVLQSAGDGPFCAGASFTELLDVTTMDQGMQFFSGFANVLNAMRKLDKIIIGRIQGKTVGGGVGIAAACDYALASEAAHIKLSELNIGIGPFVIAPAIERKMSKAALMEMSLEPHLWKSARWACEKGLFAQVFTTNDALDDAVKQTAERLATYNVEALKAMKKVSWEGTEHWGNLLYERAAISGKLILSEQSKAALAPYRKK